MATWQNGCFETMDAHPAHPTKLDVLPKQFILAAKWLVQLSSTFQTNSDNLCLIHCLYSFLYGAFMFREGWMEYPRSSYRSSLQSILRDLLDREEDTADILVGDLFTPTQTSIDTAGLLKGSVSRDF